MSTAPVEKEIIFIVDDDAAVRESLCYLLGNAGYETRSFSNVQEFCLDYNPECIGCCIFDLRIGEECGIELANYLNRISSKHPFIFLIESDSLPCRPVSIFRQPLCKVINDLQRIDRFSAASTSQSDLRMLFAAIGRMLLAAIGFCAVILNHSRRLLTSSVDQHQKRLLGERLGKKVIAT